MVSVPEEGTKVLRADGCTGEEPGAYHSAGATVIENCKGVKNKKRVTQPGEEAEDLGVAITQNEGCFLKLMVSEGFKDILTDYINLHQMPSQ